MNTWHLDDDILRRYQAGSTDLSLAGSVETHLIACATCRRLAGSVVPTERLARIWQNIEAGIDAARPTLLRRIMARLGLTTLVLALAHTATNLRRPSLPALSAMTSTTLFLAIVIWVAAYPATNDSDSGSREPASAASVSSTSGLSGPPDSDKRTAPVTAADLPMIARTLALPQNAPNGTYLKPCLLAATDQQAAPLAVAFYPYQYEQAGNVLSAIIVFRSSKGRDLLDVYVVKEGCTDEKGWLLTTLTEIQRTLYGNLGGI